MQPILQNLTALYDIGFSLSLTASACSYMYIMLLNPLAIHGHTIDFYFHIHNLNRFSACETCAGDDYIGGKHMLLLISSPQCRYHFSMETILVRGHNISGNSYCDWMNPLVVGVLNRPRIQASQIQVTLKHRTLTCRLQGSLRNS